MNLWALFLKVVSPFLDNYTDYLHFYSEHFAKLSIFSPIYILTETSKRRITIFSYLRIPSLRAVK